MTSSVRARWPANKRIQASAAGVVLTVLALVSSGCLGGGGTTILYDEERDVPLQKVAAFPVKNLKRGTGLHIDARLVKGTKADWLWMNASELPKYLDQTNVSYDWIERCSGLASSGLVGDCPIDQDGDYFFVVDNTQRPISGANPEVDGIRAKVMVRTL
jgi:hypothetical protein